MFFRDCTGGIKVEAVKTSKVDIKESFIYPAGGTDTSHGYENSRQGHMEMFSG